MGTFCGGFDTGFRAYASCEEGVRGGEGIRSRKRELDEMIEETFPASDPPSY